MLLSAGAQCQERRLRYDAEAHGKDARADPGGHEKAQPSTNVGRLPPPALTLMTELREARVTAPTSAPFT
jgi:hypothetical protein